MRGFIICTFFHQNKMLFGDKMKEDEVGDKFITNGREVRMYAKLWLGNLIG
jgi:hypothetical protein